MISDAPLAHVSAKRYLSGSRLMCGGEACAGPPVCERQRAALFVNEWAEAVHLEPDRLFEHDWLRSIAYALDARQIPRERMSADERG